MKNSKTGKTALVLGNGPSLDKLNCELVERYIDDVFVTNGFYKLHVAEQLSPNFYGLSDPAHISPNNDQTERELDLMYGYIKKVQAKLILPHRLFGQSSYREIESFFFDDRELAFFNRNTSPLKPRGYGSTTVYKVLAFANFLNYDKIYILGIDNTLFSNYRGRPDNKVSDVDQVTAKRMLEGRSEFLEEYESVFMSGMAGRMQSYAHLFGDLSLFSRAKVYNLDKNSLVDVFSKIENHPLIRN
jgi:hypothetical protein